jgi:hypothetical protein
MANITWADRIDTRTPTGADSNVSAAILNQIKTAVNSKQDAESGKSLINTEKAASLPIVGLYAITISGTDVVIEEIQPIPNVAITGVYVGVGEFRLDAAPGAFTTDKTFFSAMANATVYYYEYNLVSADRTVIKTFDDSLTNINIAAKTLFKIEIFD